MALKERFTAEVRLRMNRITTDHLVPPVRAALVIGQILAGLLCVVILIDWRGPVEVNEITGQQYWPAQALATVLALAVITLTLVIAAVRSSLSRRALLSAAAVLLTLIAVDALPLDSSRAWWTAAGLGCTVISLTLPPTRSVFDVLRCGLVLVPFVLAFNATMNAGDIDQALAALRAQQFRPAAAILLSLLAIFAAASAVENYRERSSNLMAWRITLTSVRIAAAIKLALIFALYRGLFGDLMDGALLWNARLDHPLSWLHGVVVAGIVVAVALLSITRPLPLGGFVPRLAILTWCAGVMQATALATLVAIVVFNGLRPTADTTGFFALANWTIDHGEIIQLAAVAIIFGVALLTAGISRSLDHGTYLWLIAGVWLIPPLVGSAFLSNSSTTWWAAPGQVDTALTVAVLALAFAPRPGWMTPRALMGLIIVPVVVLHLDTLWPSDSATLIKLGVVLAVVIALWVNPPPVYSSKMRNERERSLLVAGNLTILVLYIYLLNDAQLTGGLESATTIAWLWLGVPITAVLVARIRKTSAGSQKGHSPDASGQPTPTGGHVAPES